MVLTARPPAPVSMAGWAPWVLRHAGFAGVAVVGLLIPGPALGWRVLALVAGYHAAVGVV